MDSLILFKRREQTIRTLHDTFLLTANLISTLSTNDHVDDISTPPYLKYQPYLKTFNLGRLLAISRSGGLGLGAIGNSTRLFLSVNQQVHSIIEPALNMTIAGSAGTFGGLLSLIGNISLVVKTFHDLKERYNAKIASQTVFLVLTSILPEHRVSDHLFHLGRRENTSTFKENLLNLIMSPGDFLALNRENFMNETARKNVAEEIKNIPIQNLNSIQYNYRSRIEYYKEKNGAEHANLIYQVAQFKTEILACCWSIYKYDVNWASSLRKTLIEQTAIPIVGCATALLSIALGIGAILAPATFGMSASIPIIVGSGLGIAMGLGCVAHKSVKSYQSADKFRTSLFPHLEPEFFDQLKYCIPRKHSVFGATMGDFYRFVIAKRIYYEITENNFLFLSMNQYLNQELNHVIEMERRLGASSSPTQQDILDTSLLIIKIINKMVTVVLWDLIDADHTDKKIIANALKDVVQSVKNEPSSKLSQRDGIKAIYNLLRVNTK